MKRRKERNEQETKVVRSIEREHELFRYKMLTEPAGLIYDACGRIHFFEVVHEYFQYCENIDRDFVTIASGRENIMHEMYRIYLKYEYLRIEKWEDVEEILDKYVEWLGKSQHRGKRDDGAITS